MNRHPHHMEPLDFEAKELPSAEEMAELDARAISQGVSSLTLMERAAEGCVEVLLARYRQYLTLSRKPLILCGPGNNGGDGLAIARLVTQKGYSPITILTAATRYSSECQHQAQRLQETSAVLHLFGEVSAASSSLSIQTITSPQLDSLIVNSPLIIDALLGNGQKESPRGSINELTIKVIELRTRPESDQHTTAPLVAIDVPTGVSSATGECFSPCLSCDETLCIEFVKRGLVQWPARKMCGTLSLISIGIKECLKESQGSSPLTTYSLLNNERSLLEFPPRNASAHKRDFGSVIVLGGSPAMPGAPLLSAQAALRAGAGLVRVTVGNSWKVSLPTPELMGIPVGDTLSRASLPAIIPYLEDASVVVIGPGLGINEHSLQFLQAILGEVKVRKLPVVLDADALNLIAQEASLDLRSLAAVITPHPGEAARLLGMSSKEVQHDRYRAAESLYERTHSTIVLKGNGSIILSNTTKGSGKVCTAGNPYLATAGSGDVLAGLIAAFIAQGSDLFSSACKGVYVHAVSGDRIVQRRNAPLIASDLIEEVPEVIHSINEGTSFS